MSRQAYSKYKPSGIEWLGEVPEHWRTLRLKYTSSINDEVLPENTNPDHEIQYVDISSVDAVEGIKKKEIMRFEAAPSRARRRVRDGDVIVSTVRTYLRAIAPINDPEDNLIVSTGFAVIRPKRDMNGNFAAYALRAPYFVEAVVARSVGVSYPAINAGEIGTLRIAIPPGGEQRAIAAFLDRETGRIDTLMEKKQRQIELLQEKRAALISHAVTKGLDPSAPLKDSGVEWLGPIPAHWELKRLKFIAKIQTGLTLGKDYKDVPTISRPYLRVANVQDGYLDLHDITEIFIPDEDTKRHELKQGDVLMTEGGDFDKLGRGYVWEGQIEGCLHQNHIFAVRPNHKYLASLYLATLMTSSYGKAYFTSTSQQTTNLATTNITKLKHLLLPLPNIREQQSILNQLGGNISKIDGLIAKVQESIDRLKEYRTALISAGVTGKIDVREEAA